MKKRVMARAVAQKASQQLGTEVRKIRSCKSNVTNCMDDKTDSANIAELFSEKYCKLYNSVSYEHKQLAIFSDANLIDITKYCMNAASCNNTDSTCIVHTHYVTHDQVQCAINKIKLGKLDCIDGMLSDNLKNETIKLNIYISLPFPLCLLMEWFIIIKASTNP